MITRPFARSSRQRIAKAMPLAGMAGALASRKCRAAALGRVITEALWKGRISALAGIVTGAGVTWPGSE